MRCVTLVGVRPRTAQATKSGGSKDDSCDNSVVRSLTTHMLLMWEDDC